MVRDLCRKGRRQNFANFYLTQQNLVRYVVALLSCCAKIFCVSHKNVSSVFSLADYALKNQFSTQEN